MLPPKRLFRFIRSSLQQFNSQDDQAKNKDQQADPVDAIHIPYQFILRPVWVLFFQEEIFCNLAPDSHTILLYSAKLQQGLVKKEKPWKNPGPFT